MPTRSKPFSGKKKKAQLQEKRKRKQQVNENDNNTKTEDLSDEEDEDKIQELSDEERIHDTDSNEEEASSDENDRNREMHGKQTTRKEAQKQQKDLKTVFEKESQVEIDRRKADSYTPLNMEKRDQPWNILQEYIQTTPIDIPKRPAYSKDSELSEGELEKREEEQFQLWLHGIYNNYPKDRLNYFEHNLEVWRQLWRVAERSDVIALVTDARFPLFHFNEALYKYIVHDLKKPLILVFNKQDLVEPKTVFAWKLYFKKNYPELKVVTFNSFQLTDPSAPVRTDKKRKLLKKRRYSTAGGIDELIDAINSFQIKKKGILIQAEKPIRPQPDEKTNENTKSKTHHDTDSDVDEDLTDEDEELSKKTQQSLELHNAKVAQSTVLADPSECIVIGTLGHPNVGKSSLINGLLGRKVVSTSRTPGHTKHFQTIYFSSNVQLCDCPGLVFPALDRPKPLQILCGLFPIAQVREPYSAIRYLAERLPIEKIYQLQHPEYNPKTKETPPWTPWDIAEAYAKKKGYFIARTGRPDTHRAGLEILYDCIDGRIPISWPPPGFDELMKDEKLVKAVEASIPRSQQKEEAEKDIKNKEPDEDKEHPLKVDKKLQKKLRKQKQISEIIQEESDDEIEQLKELQRNIRKQHQPQSKTATQPPAPKSKKDRKKAEKAAEWQDKLEAKIRAANK